MQEENYTSSHKRRFDTAIYLHYVGCHEDNIMKKVSKEEFDNKVMSKAQKAREVKFDKKRIYRLADEKTIWYANYNVILGKVWEEYYEGKTVKSYWINIKNI